jgi:hypothetical protein
MQKLTITIERKNNSVHGDYYEVTCCDQSEKFMARTDDRKGQFTAGQAVKNFIENDLNIKE